MQSIKFYSKGKLLIAGEYLVLKGALALAMPVKFGQQMEVTKNKMASSLSWKTFIGREIWIEAEIDPVNFSIKSSNDFDKTGYLLKVLAAASKLNPAFREQMCNSSVLSRLDYNINWGLGSSATLLSNIAYWADINPFDLHFAVSDGSGYDIACARSDKPLLYKLDGKKPEIGYVDFNPSFKKQIYFVYTGRKQSSDTSVRVFYDESKISSKDIENISALSLNFMDANDICEFEGCMRAHEEILSRILNKRKIRDEKFNDFKGEIKSLGAWGGDFIMLTWKDERKALEQYLNRKNMKVIFQFPEIIYQNKEKR